MPSKKESCTVGYVSSVGDISARAMNACMVEITKEIAKKILGLIIMRKEART